MNGRHNETKPLIGSGLACCTEKRRIGAETAPGHVGLDVLQGKKAGSKLFVGKLFDALRLHERKRGTVAEKNKPIMTYRTCQNIVLIGSFFLLLNMLLLPPLVEKWGVVGREERLPQLNTPTVAAETIVKVWTYKKTGLYYCPDSKFYGKIKPGVYMTQEKALERGYRPAGQIRCR